VRDSQLFTALASRVFAGPRDTRVEGRRVVSKSDRKCPNVNCRMARVWTNFSVCPNCHRATVYAIYEPKLSSSDRRRRARTGAQRAS
jgi:hypothetical protein